jgi:DNA repair protein RadC
MNTISITIREPAASLTPTDKTLSGTEPTLIDLLIMLGLPAATRQRLTDRYPSKTLPGATIGELTKTLGKKYGARVYAALRLPELFRTTAQIFLKPKDIWEQLADIRENKKEHFVIFYLDTRNQEIKRDIISIGCLNANLVHPREVFEPAVKNLAASLIVAHNHPSGNLEPSQEDIDLTKRLTAAGKLLGIELMDHVIVSKEGFSSFKEKGLIV